MTLTEQEKTTVIHCLRLFQEELRPKYGVYGAPKSTASPLFDDIQPLTSTQIDLLCNKIIKTVRRG